MNQPAPFTDTKQQEIIEFLRQPETYKELSGGIPDAVTFIETHAAMVFLAGNHAFKIKKALAYPYLDFSSLEKREAVCCKEIAINQPHAPDIYLGVVPITRDPGGDLRLNGPGEAVEWAVHMRRFPEEALLENAIQRDELEPEFFDQLADAIVGYHKTSPEIISDNGRNRMAAIIDGLAAAFQATPDLIPHEDARQFSDCARSKLQTVASRLTARSQQGYVRRCHGDLHLGNIVVLNNQPVLFDAIEFNDEIANTDILYDLAFLLMELGHRSRGAVANRVMNRYLSASVDEENIDGLAAMPLFMACRAGIRAMVAMARAAQACEKIDGPQNLRALSYFQTALDYLEPEPVRLIAIGGFSGTGKTSLARNIAPLLCRCPGALHIRTDVERKAFFGISETTRLGPDGYLPEINEKIFARVYDKAARALEAGCSIVVDAAFLRQGERVTIEKIAQDAGISFIGLWLDADENILTTRVDARKGDASDATRDVVRGQMARGAGAVSWHQINAGGTAEQTLSDACRLCELQVFPK